MKLGLMKVGETPVTPSGAVYLEKLADTLEGDEKTGAQIIGKALEAPLRQIALNAGLEGSVIIDKIVQHP